MCAQRQLFWMALASSPQALTACTPLAHSRQSHGRVCCFPAGLAAAALFVLGYHILTFRRWGDEYTCVLKFLACFAIMVVELLWENVMVW